MDKFKDYDEAKKIILAEITNNLRIHVAISYLNKARKDLGEEVYKKLITEFNPILGLKK